VILRMLFLNLGHPSAFPFLDSPSDRNIKDGFDLLVELGAVAKSGQDYRLSKKGKLMARMPMDPRISRIVLEAAREGCLKETVVIASALSIQDPRQRPADKTLQADQAHARFKDPDSDFLTLLNIWNLYHREWETLKTQNQMRKFCRQHSLSYTRMREWVYTHDQICTILRQQKVVETKIQGGHCYESIHRSVLCGFLSNIAAKKEKNMYLAARGREVMLYPASTLFNKGPGWIVAAEIIKTSRLFARTTARIDPDWLEALGGNLCRSSYSEPHWVKQRGEVRAFQKVTLLGLVIVPRRSVSYGPINPEESHRIFVRSALVEGNMENPLPFLVENKNLVAELALIEGKLRRRDILVTDMAVADFYSERVKGIYDVAGLKKSIREKGGDDFLKLKKEDLLLKSPGDEDLAGYPEAIQAGAGAYPCEYVFAPGKEEDGVTVKVPAGLVSAIPPESLDWGIPGLLREKVTTLLKGLPKRYRKMLVPVSRTVDVILQNMDQGDDSLVNKLSSFVYRRFSVDIPASVWSGVEVPEHLKVRVTVVDHAGKELESSRDIRLLSLSDRKRHAPESSAVWERCRKRWERKGITTWDFDELPETLSLGEHLVAYPALAPAGAGVNLLLFRNREEAFASHLKGVRWLLTRHFAKDLKYLKRNLTLPGDTSDATHHVGGGAVLEEEMIDHLASHFFEKNIRRAEEMKEACETIRPLLMERAAFLKEQVLRILDALHQVQMTLQSINEPKNPETDFSRKIREEMKSLVPPDFLRVYKADRLHHLPRYLKALQIRAERGANDPEKHRIKAFEVQAFDESLQRLHRNLSPGASETKREALDDFRWMIEEFKVSLFAQELKTAFPVSKKRLEEKLKEIERMA
jgi:ATP-dependent helicase HrpA